jgi:lipoprotein Spr
MKPTRILALLLCLAQLVLVSCHSSRKLSNYSETNNRNDALREKYAPQLGINPDEITNIPLYSFIDEWIGAPYHYGGKDKNGVDCSGFTEILYNKVFGKQITGSSRDLFEKCKVVSTDDLKEGDLLFFKIESDKISHVGVYLTNKHFVHATVKKGVMINGMEEAYYKKYFFKAGRLL